MMFLFKGSLVLTSSFVWEVVDFEIVQLLWSLQRKRSKLNIGKAMKRTMIINAEDITFLSSQKLGCNLAVVGNAWQKGKKVWDKLRNSWPTFIRNINLMGHFMSFYVSLLYSNFEIFYVAKTTSRSSVILIITTTIP